MPRLVDPVLLFHRVDTEKHTIQLQGWVVDLPSELPCWVGPTTEHEFMQLSFEALNKGWRTLLLSNRLQGSQHQEYCRGSTNQGAIAGIIPILLPSKGELCRRCCARMNHVRIGTVSSVYAPVNYPVQLLHPYIPRYFPIVVSPVVVVVMQSPPPHCLSTIFI